MQAIARWGNFFNQELYGSPTTLPWGIPIDCAHRIAGAGFDYTCAVLPETTRFHPLFLYESLSGALGAIVLIWLGFHARKRLRPGDLLLVFFVWYGAVRFTLEAFREGNWTFFGVPTAQIVSTLFILGALVILFWRHRSGAPLDDPATFPADQTWGAIGRPVDPDELDDDDDDDDDDDYDDDEEADEDDGDEEDGDEDDDGDEPTNPTTRNPTTTAATSSAPTASRTTTSTTTATRPRTIRPRTGRLRRRPRTRDLARP